MAIKEKATNQKVILAMNTVVVSNAVAYSAIIDTADYDNGVYFAFALVGYDSTDADITFQIEEGDAANMSDADDVPAAKLVYGTAVVLDAANVVGSNLYKEGVHSTKRYLRVEITPTGVDTSIQVLILAIVNPEVLPTAQV